VIVILGHITLALSDRDAQAVDTADGQGRRVEHVGLPHPHAAGARRVQRRLGVARDPVEDLLVGLNAGASRPESQVAGMIGP
jgi:hypothetical protein